MAPEVVRGGNLGHDIVSWKYSVPSNVSIKYNWQYILFNLKMLLYCLKIPLAQTFKDICTSQVLLAVIENYFNSSL